MSTTCENCLDEAKYHSSNTDSFTGKKFDIYFCNRCFVGKTNLDKNFDFTPYYPKNYYGQVGQVGNILCCRGRRRKLAIRRWLVHRSEPRPQSISNSLTMRRSG